MSYWPIRIFELASPGGAGAGISCDANGAFLGTIPLLEERRDVWRTRPVAALNEELSALFGVPVDFISKLDGLAVIANALNDDNIVKAKIAASVTVARTTDKIEPEQPRYNRRCAQTILCGHTLENVGARKASPVACRAVRRRTFPTGRW